MTGQSLIELRKNTLELVESYQKNPSVRLRNEVVLSYDRLIWKWVKQFARPYQYQDAYQFVCYRLLYYLDRNHRYENLDAYIRTMIPKSLLVFRQEQYFKYAARTELITDVGLLELQLAASYQVGYSIEEVEIWETVEAVLKNAPQKLLVARKIWRDGWSIQDVEQVYHLTNKQVNAALVKAKNSVRKHLQGYELPTKQSDRESIHLEIIKQRKQGLGLKALSDRFSYSRKGIWNILQKYNVA